MNHNQKDLHFRPVQLEDIPQICQFPRTEEELFFMFPKAKYPLTPEQLETAVENRYDSHVVCHQNKPVAFANFYERVIDHFCSIGNVIVNPEKRGLGIGKYLIDHMIELAIFQYQIKEMRLVCFNTNTKALLFYTKYGFIPYEFKQRESYTGENIVSIYMRFPIRSISEEQL